jgi:hypothetical protein
VTLLLIAIGSAGRAAIAQRRVVGYVPLKASELPMLAPRLVGHDVEVFAEFFTATPLNSPRRGVVGSFSAGEHGSGTQLGDVVFDTTAQEAMQWIVRNDCRRTCSKVFVRGRIVRRPFAQTPVLEMAEISYESKIGVRPASSDLADKIAALERPGAAKPLLPPHTILPKPSGGLPVQPPVATKDSTTDSTKNKPRLRPGASDSIWQSMVNRAEEQRRRDFNADLLIISGPERPKDFETSYRSIRYTGLWKLFTSFPYQDMRTLWPRVAIIVQEKPDLQASLLPNGALPVGPRGFFANGQPATDYCWRLWARVWTDSARSVDIAPFNWCYSETHFNESLSPVSLWGSRPATNMHLNRFSTGTTRTTGPVPPETPLPRTNYGLSGPNTPMVGSLLLDMGIPLGDPAMPDGRVWFLEDSKPYEEREPAPAPAPVNNVLVALPLPPAEAEPAPPPRSARTFAAIVADVRRGQIMITVGGSDGVSVDDEYPILRREGAKVTQVGTIKITEVANTSATGTLTSGEARFYDCVRACPPPTAITQSSPQPTATVAPLAPTAFSLQGTEHLRYDVTMTVASMTQSGFYEVDASPAEAGRIAVRIQGKFGGQEYSSTITLAPKEPIPLDQLAQLGPIAVVLLQLQAYSLTSAFKVESTCQYAGLQGRREVVRQGNQIVVERCVSPDVGFPLAMIVSPYAITLTQFRK